LIIRITEVIEVDGHLLKLSSWNY